MTTTVSQAAAPDTNADRIRTEAEWRVATARSEARHAKFHCAEMFLGVIAEDAQHLSFAARCFQAAAARYREAADLYASIPGGDYGWKINGLRCSVNACEKSAASLTRRIGRR